jgi:hypothetical protein
MTTNKGPKTKGGVLEKYPRSVETKQNSLGRLGRIGGPIARELAHPRRIFHRNHIVQVSNWMPKTVAASHKRGEYCRRDRASTLDQRYISSSNFAGSFDSLAFMHTSPVRTTFT